VKLETVSEFLKAGSSAVAVGEPIFQKRALDANDYEAIARNTASFISLCKTK